MNEVCESTTGEWLRDLASVVDKKDTQIKEQASKINDLTHNRKIVGWLHPSSRRFVYDDSKQHAIKTGAKSAAEMAAHTVPVFIQLER
tara:strand:- start:1565 stop:1828 length:264 start_codon:yes stop_codon:yes gene_type:complete